MSNEIKTLEQACRNEHLGVKFKCLGATASLYHHRYSVGLCGARLSQQDVIGVINVDKFAVSLYLLTLISHIRR